MYFNILHKISLYSLAILLGFSTLKAQIVISEGTQIVDGAGAHGFVKAGDTLYLSGVVSYFIIKNLTGEAGNPIHITNVPGQSFKVDANFNYGVSIRNVKHLNFFSSNVANNRGIVISNSGGYGMDVGYLSTNYTINNLEIGPVGIGPGILAKTDPDCSYASIRANFVQENCTFKNNYIHDTDTEGIYIGYTFYDGIVKNCGGKDTLLLPHLIKNTLVENNLLVRNGWDGIQLSSSPNSVVRYNKVFNDSQKKTEYQMNGIILGDGFSGLAYNNLIVDGEGSGIFIKGMGDIVVENNIIINPAYNNTQESGKYGMYVDFSSSEANNISIGHNLIANPRFEGIRYINPAANLASIANNVIIHNDSLFGNKNNLINIFDAEPTINTKNLIITEDFAQNNFWMDGDSLDQKNGAVTINQGISSASTLNFDFYNRARSTESGVIDIGPFENGSSANGIFENNNSKTCILNANSLVSVYDLSFKKIETNMEFKAAVLKLQGVFIILNEDTGCIRKVLLP